MTKKIRIANITSTSMPTGKGGTYHKLTVAFEDLDTGKLNNKNVMSFVNKPVYEALSVAKANDLFEITEQPSKDPKYTEFATVKHIGTYGGGATGSPAMPKNSGGTTSSGSYPNSEERAATQRNIVRQSSLDRAIQLLTLQGKKTATTDDVCQVASKFEEYVFNGVKGDPVSSSIAAAKRANDELNDDIPL